jgi:hypothetical protein
MSVWSRTLNAFRWERVDRDIDDELQSHVDEAIAHGRDPVRRRHVVILAIAMA